MRPLPQNKSLRKEFPDWGLESKLIFPDSEWIWGPQNLQEIKKDFFKELLVKSVSFQTYYIRVFAGVGLCGYWRGIFVTWVFGGGLSLVLKAFGLLSPWCRENGQT